MSILSDLRQEVLQIRLCNKIVQIRAYFNQDVLIRLSLSLTGSHLKNPNHPLGKQLLDILDSNETARDKIPYHLDGTPFQLKVWHETMKIPYGTTATYGQIAKAIGCRSPRAVGQALNKNPLPIIVPCHRVIGKNGKLTGFSSGIHIKELLLLAEKAKF